MSVAAAPVPEGVDREDNEFLKRQAAKRADWFVKPAKGSKGRPRFVAKRAADALHAETPIARGGQTLWIHDDDSGYREGEEDLKLRIAETLADDWRKSYRDEVITLLLDRSEKFLEEPPLDRIRASNGILNISDPANPKLTPHSPAFLSPVRIGAAYDPDATCPANDKFIAETVGAETAPLIHEIAGYLITPDNSLQTAFLFVGKGGNGKSTEIGVLEALLGSENCAHVGLQKLEEDRFAPVDLYGKLTNDVADLDSKALRSSSTFKAITGGDVIRAERKFRDAFTFKPFARLIFSANIVPEVTDSSHAFFRRWTIIPYEQTFAIGAPGTDEKLLEKLTTPAELSGLLNHALAALPALRARGRFTETEATRRAAATFRVHADSVAAFIEERCIREPGEQIRRPLLYQGYGAWCELNGRAAMTSTRFYGQIRELGDVGEKASRGVDYFTGIGPVPS